MCQSNKRTQVLVFRRPPSDSQRGKDRCYFIRQLSNRNVPRVIFEAEVENDLRCHRVDGRVENPTARYVRIESLQVHYVVRLTLL